MMRTWRVWALDTWGNEEDGWTINDRREWPSVTFDDDGTEDAQVLEAIKDSIGGPMLVAVDVQWEHGPNGWCAIMIDNAETLEPLLVLEAEDA